MEEDIPLMMSSYRLIDDEDTKGSAIEQGFELGCPKARRLAQLAMGTTRRFCFGDITVVGHGVLGGTNESGMHSSGHPLQYNLFARRRGEALPQMQEDFAD